MPRDCVLNADHTDTVAKGYLVERITMLSPEKVAGGHTAKTPGKTRVIGGATVTVLGGRNGGIDVRLTRQGLALLHTHRRLPCRLTITATAPGLVKPVSGSWPLELKRPRRRGRSALTTSP